MKGLPPTGERLEDNPLPRKNEYPGPAERGSEQILLPARGGKFNDWNTLRANGIQATVMAPVLRHPGRPLHTLELGVILNLSPQKGCTEQFPLRIRVRDLSSVEVLKPAAYDKLFLQHPCLTQLLRFREKGFASSKRALTYKAEP
jgi:hypothetical protein